MDKLLFGAMIRPEEAVLASRHSTHCMPALDVR